MSKKLSPKQEQFCQQYLKDLNATAAYKRSYPNCKSDGAARTGSAKLLANHNIRAYVDKLRLKAQQRTEVTQDRVLKELATVAFSHIGLVCDWTTDGGLALRDREDLSDEHLASLQSIQQIEVKTKEGGLITTRTQFRMHDKLKALELLCKYLGILDGAGARNTNSRDDVSRRLRDSIRTFMGE